MATISVPLTPQLEERLDSLVTEGVGANRADVIRRALTRFAEEEAVNAILKAEREPTLRGDLKTLLRKIN